MSGSPKQSSGHLQLRIRWLVEDWKHLVGQMKLNRSEAEAHNSKYPEHTVDLARWDEMIAESEARIGKLEESR